MPARSAEFNHPMHCLPVVGGAGTLPADGSLLSIEPAGMAQLGALKAAGNPTSIGSVAAVDPESVTLRLVETAGTPTDVSITSQVAEISDLLPADLLENVRAQGDPLQLHGYQISTVRARLQAERIIDATGQALAPDAEPAQLLYARYWLHNRGPAPLGGLPAVAHLHPEALSARPGETVELRLSVASDCSDATPPVQCECATRPGGRISRRPGCGRLGNPSNSHRAGTGTRSSPLPFRPKRHPAVPGERRVDAQRRLAGGLAANRRRRLRHRRRRRDR